MNHAVSQMTEQFNCKHLGWLLLSLFVVFQALASKFHAGQIKFSSSALSTLGLRANDNTRAL
jgi:hypothetical protein